MENKESLFPPILAKEGWHVLHQIYTLDSCKWKSIPSGEQAFALKHFQAEVESFQAMQKGQVRFFSVLGKADFGFMAITADLHELDRFEKRLRASMGTGVLVPVYSFLSLTEESEYTTSEEEFGKTLQQDENLEPGTSEYAARIAAFNERMAKYRYERVYPVLGDWKTICFYPMAKRRSPGQNWYALSHEDRRRLMGGHARVGRTYAGRVKQLITGSTGLGDWEWGVTLFSNSVDEFKAIIYEMRFDEVSHQYAEFGPFYIGLILSEEALFQRLGIVV